MRRRGAALIALAAVLAAAGAAGTVLLRPSAGPAGDALDVPPGQSGPLDVTVTLDAGNSASREIGPDGGTIKAVGRDGTRFELEFPPGSLAEGTRITVIPVASISSFPFSGGLLGGVQFEPDGLRLAAPAVLTIEPAAVAAPDETVGFAYYGSGSDLHMYPLDPGEALRMTIWHFSGAGAGKATDADRERQGQRTPRSPEAQLWQRVAEWLAHERAKQLLGTASEDADREAQRLLEEAVQATVTRALAECDAASLLQVERMAQLLGVSWVSDAQAREFDEKCDRLILALDSTITAKHHRGLWHHEMRAAMADATVRSDGNGDLVGTGSVAVTFTQSGSVPGVFCHVTLTAKLPVRIRVVGGTGSPSPTLILTFEPADAETLDPCPEDEQVAASKWHDLLAQLHGDELLVTDEFRITGWTHSGDGSARSWHKSYVREAQGETFLGETFPIFESTTIELRRGPAR